jgi:hypothetical protein
MLNPVLKQYARCLALPFALAALLTAAPVAAEQEQASGPLDGMVFVGKIGPQGNPDVDDELHFQDGKFWSLNCIKCGFQPSGYWVRKVGERILFRGELTGERGTLAYSGEVVGGRAEVSIQWSKSRWYWTLSKALEFSGSFKPQAKALSVDHAVDTANSAQPELDPVCSR